jgi:sortase A
VDEEAPDHGVPPWGTAVDETLPQDRIPHDLLRPPGHPPVPVDSPPERWRTVARGLGELLVTCGIVLLLFVVYELWVTDLFNQHAQTELTQQLQQEWKATPQSTPASTAHGAVPVGKAFAILHIPRLGSDYRRAIVEGTGQDQLTQGPGHYVGTAFPGEQGNVGIAGHRVGKGSPFLDLDKLKPGDPIIVETAQSWFVYRVLGDPATGDFTTDASGIAGQQIVLPTETDVISPTPNAGSAAAASGAYLTLTTCHPRFSARQRLIIHAKLDGTGTSKTDAPDGPPALRGR